MHRLHTPTYTYKHSALPHLPPLCPGYLRQVRARQGLPNNPQVGGTCLRCPRAPCAWRPCLGKSCPGCQSAALSSRKPSSTYPTPGLRPGPPGPKTELALSWHPQIAAERTNERANGLSHPVTLLLAHQRTAGSQVIWSRRREPKPQLLYRACLPDSEWQPGGRGP